MTINWGFVFDEEEEKKKQQQAQKAQTGVNWDKVFEEDLPKQVAKKESKPKKSIMDSKAVKWLESKGPEKPPKPNTPEYDKYMQDWADKQADKPIRSGLVDALSFGITPKLEKKLYDVSGLEQAKEEEPLKYKAGQIGGEVLKTAAMYNIANPLAEKIPGINNIKNPFLKTQATMLGADTLVNIPTTLIDGAVNKKTPGEMVKDFAGREVTDAAMNLAVGGLGEGIKKLKQNKEVIKTPQDILTESLGGRRIGDASDVIGKPGNYKVTSKAKKAAEAAANSFSEAEPIIPKETKILPIKDIKPIDKNFRDLYRNMKDAFGDNYDVVNDSIIKPFNDAKMSNVKMQEQWTDKAYNTVVKDLGIKKGSKLSALVQRFGEGNMTEDQLKEILSPKDVDKVIKADKFFRESYDELLGIVNQSRSSAYGDNADMLITPRKDYYRHFQDLSGKYSEKIKKVLNLADDTPGMAIKTRKAKSSHFGIGKQRTGGMEYTEDAVGGFLDYVKAASYATNIDTQIPHFRKLANDINKVAPGEYTNFVNYVNEFADDLAGTQNWLDKGLQSVIGRKSFGIIDSLNKRAKANVVMGNISSSLSQIANVPQGIATIKDPKALTMGAADTMAGVIGKGKMKEVQKNSGFLSERFMGDLYSRFDTKLVEQPAKFAGWMLEVLDDVGTKFIWNSAYRKGLTDGVQEPIRYADEIARNMVAGRGIGELPLMQKSKVFQMLAPFQVEVANLWHVQKDMVKEKDFGGLVGLYLANFVLNKGLESVRGSGATFDPIDALVDAVNEPDKTPLTVAGRLGGEVLSNLPLGQTAATLVPEQYRQQLFGKQDPTRFGTDGMMVRAIQKPLTSLALPWGGGQVAKTAKGLTAAGVIPELNPLKENFGETADQPGVYNSTGGETKMRFPIDDNPKSKLQAALFGPNATGEARDYYEQNRKPLSEKQTKQVQAGMDYETTQKLRKVETLKRKLNGIAKDPKLSDEKKTKQMNDLIQQLEQLVSELGG